MHEIKSEKRITSFPAIFKNEGKRAIFFDEIEVEHYLWIIAHKAKPLWKEVVMSLITTRS